MGTVQPAAPETGPEAEVLARTSGASALGRAWQVLEQGSARYPTQTHAFFAALAGSQAARVAIVWPTDEARHFTPYKASLKMSI